MNAADPELQRVSDGAPSKSSGVEIKNSLKTHPHGWRALTDVYTEGSQGLSVSPDNNRNGSFPDTLGGKEHPGRGMGFGNGVLRESMV